MIHTDKFSTITRTPDFDQVDQAFVNVMSDDLYWMQLILLRSLELLWEKFLMELVIVLVIIQRQIVMRPRLPLCRRDRWRTTFRVLSRIQLRFRILKRHII